MITKSNEESYGHRRSRLFEDKREVELIVVLKRSNLITRSRDRSTPSLESSSSRKYSARLNSGNYVFC